MIIIRSQQVRDCNPATYSMVMGEREEESIGHFYRGSTTVSSEFPALLDTD